MRASLVIVAAAAGLLTACSVFYTDPEVLAAQQCTEYGYPAGHPEHGQCRLMLAQMRYQQAAAAAGNPGLALAGSALLQGALYPPAPQRPTWITPMRMCGAAYLGGPVTC